MKRTKYVIKNQEVLDRTKIESITVSGKKYPVLDTPTYVRAHLFGFKGWNAVYVMQGPNAYTQLVGRIKEALKSAPLPVFASQR